MPGIDRDRLAVELRRDHGVVHPHGHVADVDAALILGVDDDRRDRFRHLGRPLRAVVTNDRRTALRAAHEEPLPGEAKAPCRASLLSILGRQRARHVVRARGHRGRRDRRDRRERDDAALHPITSAARSGLIAAILAAPVYPGQSPSCSILRPRGCRVGSSARDRTAPSRSSCRARPSRARRTSLPASPREPRPRSPAASRRSPSP